MCVADCGVDLILPQLVRLGHDESQHHHCKALRSTSPETACLLTERENMNNSLFYKELTCVEQAQGGEVASEPAKDVQPGCYLAHEAAGSECILQAVERGNQKRDAVVPAPELRAGRRGRLRCG